MTVIEFLRDIGKHFSIARMLAKESVSARVSDEGISFTEFSYQILQAMDYLELFRRYGCVLQSGGSDQWGNLTAGVDLIRRVEGATVHALATPLVTRSDGQKYGKTEAGAVWLDPASTSPFAFYQYFLNQADADAVPLLKVFSFRSRGDIEELERVTAERPEARAAQRALAEELTELVHGAEEASRAVAASAALFGDGELAKLGEEALRASLREVPRAEIRGDLPPLLDLLVATGLAASRSEARRALSEGGIYLNNQRVMDPAAAPSAGDLIHGRWLVLRRGKRQLAAVERVD
jgi:tyrosyl-tRNA synthetase